MKNWSRHFHRWGTYLSRAWFGYPLRYVKEWNRRSEWMKPTNIMKNIRKRLKYIFPVLIAIMIAGLVLSRVVQPDSSIPEPDIRIEAAEASDYIGRAAEVCGEVASADHLPRVGGEPTFLNLSCAYPDQSFTAVIWGDNRAKWRQPPEQRYANREICVGGKIEMYEGTPQIIVEDPDQIEIQ